MYDLFPNISHFLRNYLSEEFFLFTAGIPGLLSFLFQLAFFFYSVLRVNRAMKRDGIEPPPLHWLNIFGYLNIFAASSKSIEKMVQVEQAAGVAMRSFSLLRTTLVIPYIKPVDRFIARSFYFFGGIGLIFALFYMWLYPD